MNTQNQIQQFVDYVLSFYGKGGIYDFGATSDQVLEALAVRLVRHHDTPFDSDSVDREWVRDIMLEMRGKTAWGVA